MKAAVLHRAGSPFVIEDVDLAPPRFGEARVRIAAAGVCRSDHHVMTGATAHPLPVVCGHEGAGVVEEVGAGVLDLAVGDRVVLSWAPSCDACFYCEAGLPTQCEAYLKAIWDGTMVDGTPRLSLKEKGSGASRPVYHYAALACFAEATVVPASCCIKVPDGVPLAPAALVGCSVTTGVGAALFRAKVTRGSSVAVFGCGGVGASIVQGARLAGAAVIIAIDRHRGRLDQALAFGATHAVEAGREDPIQVIRSLTDGRGADYTFEAIGIPAVMAQAVEGARRGGMVVLVGLGAHDETIPLSAGSFTRSDKILAGAYYGLATPRRDMPRLLELYRDGDLMLDEMIGRRRPLSEISEAFADLQAGDSLRTLLVIDPNIT